MISFSTEQEHNSRFSSPLPHASSTIVRDIQQEFGVSFPTLCWRPMTTPGHHVQNILDSTPNSAGHPATNTSTVMGGTPLLQPPTGSPQTPVDSPNANHTISDDWSETTATPSDTAPPPPTRVVVCNPRDIHVPPFVATDAFSREQYESYVPSRPVAPLRVHGRSRELHPIRTSKARRLHELLWQQ